MRVQQQPAYVLLNRPYSETSWICELFTRDYGRLAVIAKGARRFKSPWRGVLLPFQPLLLSWSGKGEVPTLTGAELDLSAINLFEQELRGEALICGFYCNELVTYLLHRHDPHRALFECYANALSALANAEQAKLWTELRVFEKQVVRETGYAINFAIEADAKTPIRENYYYQFMPNQGFVVCDQTHPKALHGRIILALNNDLQEQTELQLSSEEIALSKQLMRDILSQSLGFKPIHSRSLFLRDKFSPNRTHSDTASHDSTRR